MKHIIRLTLMMGLIMQTPISQAEQAASNMEKATFAGGCFWCLEHPFDSLDGVISVRSGYIGGFQNDPTYETVSAGETGHTEAVQVIFDPTIVPYKALLAVYWRNSDPTTPNRQFCDVGSQYRPGIFYHSETQQALAEASKHDLQQHKSFTADIITEITAAGTFWVAEEYHQQYYRKNPVRYKFYRFNCGRDQRLEQLWGAAGE